MEEFNPDLFETFESLVSVDIEGRKYKLPENNCILRGLQFIEADFSMSKFCWNGDCENCLISFHDQKDSPEKTGLACQQCAFNGMAINRLPEGVKTRK